MKLNQGRNASCATWTIPRRRHVAALSPSLHNMAPTTAWSRLILSKQMVTAACASRRRLDVSSATVSMPPVPRAVVDQ